MRVDWGGLSTFEKGDSFKLLHRRVNEKPNQQTKNSPVPYRRSIPNNHLCLVVCEYDLNMGDSESIQVLVLPDGKKTAVFDWDNKTVIAKFAMFLESFKNKINPMILNQ